MSDFFCICFIIAFFHVTAHFPAFSEHLKNYAWGEREREREACGERREMPLLLGQAFLLGVWPWKRTPFSKTSNGSHIGYHYYAVICMHPFVSFPFNHAHGSTAQFLKLVIKNNADLNWRLKFHLQVLMVWWMKQLQSQSKITPSPRQPSPLKTRACVYTERRQCLVAAQAAPALSPSQTPRLTDRDFLLRWEPSRHSPAIKGLPSVTEADLQQELIHTVSHVCSPSLPPPYTYIQTHTYTHTQTHVRHCWKKKKNPHILPL